MSTPEEWPRVCAILATVKNADGKAVTVELGTNYGTRAETMARINGGTFKQVYRPVALDMASSAGLTLHGSGMRVTWDAAEL